MLIQVFKSVLLMSIVGGVFALLWLCLKPVTRKLVSPQSQYYVWLTVLIVMILPVRFSLPQRATAVLPTNQVQNVETETEIVMENNQTTAAEQKFPEAHKIRRIDLPQTVTWYLGMIWCLGVIAVLLVKAVKYLLFLSALYKNSSADKTYSNIPKQLQVRRTGMLDAPCIVGLLKPVLFMPDIELSQSHLNYILMHELTHYRRHDLLYKWFTMLVASVHWFNPFIYIVSKQIDLDCEVSCDFAVTRKLSQQEKDEYMKMILNMLSNTKRNLRPLTTQMAGSKTTLTRRFTMIRNKKTTSKLMSVLSAIIAVVMLSTTVFASGVLSGLTEEQYTIEVTNNGEKIELANNPFIENGEVYLPLRETFEKIGVMENEYSNIKWNNGKIELDIAFYDNSAYAAEAHQQLTQTQGVDTIAILYQFGIEIDSASLVLNPAPSLAGQDISSVKAMENAPILKGSITYIPYSYVNEMLDKQVWNVEYSVYDNSGTRLDKPSIRLDDLSGTVVVTSEYAPTTPEYAVEQFFRFFEQGDLENMKRYCTEAMITNFFGDGYCFGMTKASLVEMNIDPLEYTKSSNDFNIFVNVNMTQHENSVYEPSQTSTSFYVFLLRQPDGRYLIDEFGR